MNDQAEALRNMMRQEDRPLSGGGRGERGSRPAGQQARQTRIFTITSGKGGVGKSNFTLNFALQLQTIGYKVLVFDADIGMANIDVLMGASPRYNLYHLIKREKSIQEIIYRGHNDLQFIAGGSGFHDLLTLTREELDYFTEQVQSLNGTVDFVLFDTGAGLSKESLRFITAAEQAIVVTTPEPTSITDAYAIIKMVHAQQPDVRFQLVVNRVTDGKEGKHTADKIRLVSNQFLKLDIPALGFIPDDINVSRAVKRQIPFTVLYPDTAASKGLKELVARFEQSKPVDATAEDADAGAVGVKRFLNRMLSFLK